MTATTGKPTTSARRSHRVGHLPGVTFRATIDPTTPMGPIGQCADCSGAELARGQHIVEEVGVQIRDRLVPVLKAIDLLADSQRVLNALSAAAMVDESLDLRMRSVVDAWCNPMSDSTRDGYAVLAELAGVASSMAGELCANAIAEIDRRDRAEADAGT